MAVEFREVEKSYDSSVFGKAVPVLENINLLIPAGEIFGLLGPSGCGKTTLLKCIVNRIKPNAGTITVLGSPLGSPESGVPGPNVGYMPQELALVLELTIAQTLWYTGRLSCMDTFKLKHRMEYLMGVLQLPDETCLVAELSGGQRRRVSFAVALLHEPKLLILDEPTVGLDPLLRVSIFDHLMQLAQETRVTVVITTHYIEEARRAHTVGLMRRGRILAHSPPMKLLDTYGVSSMEAVFLHLCHEDEFNHNSYAANRSITSVNNETYQEELSQNSETLEMQGNVSSKMKSYLVKKLQRIHALTYRNFHSVLRSKLTMFTQVIMPTLSLILVTIVLYDFHDVNVAVASTDNFMGHLYLKQINSALITQIQHESRESALESVLQGKAWGSIYIHPNFSEATIQRFMDGSQASNESVFGSTVVIQLDLTEYQVAYVIQKELIKAYLEFGVDLLTHYNVNPAIAQFPISFEKPIYGRANLTFNIEAFLPGILAHLTFHFASFLTSLAFICERNSGLLDRVWVSGADRIDVTVSHFVVQGAFMICQITVASITVFGIYETPSEGSITLIISILYLLGQCGITFGYLVSTIVPNETAAILVEVSWFIISFLLMGSLWPIEAMPKWISYIAYISPQTLPAVSVRSVLLRGWTLRDFQIWLTCLTTITWTVAFTAVSQLVMYLRE